MPGQLGPVVGAGNASLGKKRVDLRTSVALLPAQVIIVEGNHHGPGAEVFQYAAEDLRQGRLSAARGAAKSDEPVAG